jgi:hypothetical protein
VTGGIYGSADDLIAALPSVLALDRATVRRRAVERFGVARMVDEHLAVYDRLLAGRSGGVPVTLVGRTTQHG